jgi:hypothetical protein
MEKMLMRNAYNARYVIASFTGVLAVYNFLGMNYLTHYEIFGYDGNGGHMLKIITDLTDEEMARLKYVRRTSWHWAGARR